MTKVVRIFNTHFEVDSQGASQPIFEGGKFYPVTEATERQVVLRNGEVVDAPEDYEKALAAAEAAKAAAEKAAVKADATADAAQAAAAAAGIDSAPAEAQG